MRSSGPLLPSQKKSSKYVPHQGESNPQPQQPVPLERRPLYYRVQRKKVKYTHAKRTLSASKRIYLNPWSCTKGNWTPHLTVRMALWCRPFHYKCTTHENGYRARIMNQSFSAKMIVTSDLCLSNLFSNYRRTTSIEMAPRIPQHHGKYSRLYYSEEMYARPGGFRRHLWKMKILLGSFIFKLHRGESNPRPELHK
jgi:hypothetical protein